MAPCNRKILVVEDDREIRESLKMALEIEGYDVGTAANGREGLDYLGSNAHPCLILLDLMMPVMDGWAFAKEMAENALFSKVPIVVLTAFAEKTVSVPGARQVLRKPVDLDALLRVTGNLC